MEYLLIYVAAYFSLVSPVETPLIPVQTPLHGFVAIKGIVPGTVYWPIRPVVAQGWRYPDFRNGDWNTRMLFEPMISLDMRIRREYWKVDRFIPNP
jgi:hypothetical protein